MMTIETCEHGIYPIRTCEICSQAEGQVKSNLDTGGTSVVASKATEKRRDKGMKQETLFQWEKDQVLLENWAPGPGSDEESVEEDCLNKDGITQG
jgi:hypothetical protein